MLGLGAESAPETPYHRDCGISCHDSNTAFNYISNELSGMEKKF